MSKQESHNEVGDVVLVHLDEQPAGYARVEEIRGHSRPDWYECDLLFLGSPLQMVTWILEREQIDGAPFTMGGRPVKIEGLPPPGQAFQASEISPSAQPSEPEQKRGEGDKVLRLVPKKPAE